MKAQRWTVDRWTVDYGDGRESVSVPHAWRQDMDVREEGPVVYRSKLKLPPEPAHLVFHGVSYAAEVRVNGEVRATHRGIWDAFEVPLDDLADEQVEIEVSLTKNGGPTYPVKECASGFLPYVFHTFGGIFREVELVLEKAGGQSPWQPRNRVRVEGRQIFVDDRPFYPRGLLHWGWYPELGHPNPPLETIRKEVKKAKSLGFNLVKFCLWVPPHRYLDILAQEGMEAWLELPIWMPSEDPAAQKQIFDEVLAVARQYSRHDNIIIWSIGCELGRALSSQDREWLCGTVRNLTHSPLVGDSSGGAEMYGGGLREFGDFDDFHPYCDLPFYAPVLDSLLPGPRRVRPLLLGEFNDMDVHRDLGKLHHDMPYWASTMRELNDEGVRWQHDLSRVVALSRFTADVRASRALLKSSITKASFVRKTVQEKVRARAEIGGYVVTGWRDTPISTSGFFDDWGASRFESEDVARWNGSDCLFLIPNRRPPWVHGGNRPAFEDPMNVFEGPCRWRVGLHSEAGCEAGLIWRIEGAHQRGTAPIVRVEAGDAREVAEIEWNATPGTYKLHAETAGATNEWPVTVVPAFDSERFQHLRVVDPRGLMPDLLAEGAGPVVSIGDLSVLNSGKGGLLFLLDEGTQAVPFWRESSYEFKNPAFWEIVPFADRWRRLMSVSPDRAIYPLWLKQELPKGAEVEVLMNRIDARTFGELPMLVRVSIGGVQWLITTLRPFGGLGSQPPCLTANPAGCLLLTSLIAALEAPSTEPLETVEA